MCYLQSYSKNHSMDSFLPICFDKSYWDGKMISIDLKWSVFMTTDESEREREREECVCVCMCVCVCVLLLLQSHFTLLKDLNIESDLKTYIFVTIIIIH